MTGVDKPKTARQNSRADPTFAVQQASARAALAMEFFGPAKSSVHMSNPVLPNFFIVGAPKAGSTSLYYYLDQDRKWLIEYYSEDIRQLQQLVGRDLSAWMR